MAALIDRELLQDSTFDGSSNDSVLTQLNVTPNPEISFPTQTNPATPADSNVALVETKIDYSLNINKALKKKIATCKQVKAEYEYTGGGITGGMDTATFELFRTACSKLYREFPPYEGHCTVIDTDDKHRKAVVQHTFKVSRMIGENSVSYTVNLYPTNNRLLINGKDVDKFMESHLPLLHQMMIRALSEDGFSGVESMNRMLADQMQFILNQRRGGDEVSTNSSSNEVPTIVTANNGNRPALQCDQQEAPAVVETTSGRTLSRTRSSTRLKDGKTQVKKVETKTRSEVKKAEGERCLVCSRNAVTRAAECKIGGHWVHYRCDKLTDDEINRLGNDSGFIYNCKRCSTKETTPKTIVYGSEPTSPKSNGEPRSSSETVEAEPSLCSTILRIPSPTVVSSSSTPAMAMLNEESDPVCGVCDKNLCDDVNVCDNCRGLCHSDCMTDPESELCVACGAKGLQDVLMNGTKLRRTKSPIPSGDDAWPKTEVQVSQRDRTPVKPVGTRPKSSSQTEGMSNKNRELRQQDLKLRKWEEELKLRETRCNERNKDFSQLEDYVRRTEARNVELEKTVGTLERKIYVLESEPSAQRIGIAIPVSNDVGSVSSTNKSHVNPFRSVIDDSMKSQDYPGSTDQLIIGVRDQVTHYIMNRVRSEFEQLERIATAQNTPIVVKPPASDPCLHQGQHETNQSTWMHEAALQPHVYSMHSVQPKITQPMPQANLQPQLLNPNIQPSVGVRDLHPRLQPQSVLQQNRKMLNPQPDASEPCNPVVIGSIGPSLRRGANYMGLPETCRASQQCHQQPMEATAGINGMPEAERYPSVIDLTAPSPDVQNSTRSKGEERAPHVSMRLSHNTVQLDSSQREQHDTLDVARKPSPLAHLYTGQPLVVQAPAQQPAQGQAHYFLPQAQPLWMRR